MQPDSKIRYASFLSNEQVPLQGPIVNEVPVAVAADNALDGRSPETGRSTALETLFQYELSPVPIDTTGWTPEEKTELGRRILYDMTLTRETREVSLEEIRLFDDLVGRYAHYEANGSGREGLNEPRGVEGTWHVGSEWLKRRRGGEPVAMVAMVDSLVGIRSRRDNREAALAARIEPDGGLNFPYEGPPQYYSPAVPAWTKEEPDQRSQQTAETAQGIDARQQREPAVRKASAWLSAAGVAALKRGAATAREVHAGYVDERDGGVKYEQWNEGYSQYLGRLVFAALWKREMPGLEEGRLHIEVADGPEGPERYARAEFGERLTALVGADSDVHRRWTGARSVKLPMPPESSERAYQIPAWEAAGGWLKGSMPGKVVATIHNGEILDSAEGAVRDSMSLEERRERTIKWARTMPEEEYNDLNMRLRLSMGPLQRITPKPGSFSITPDQLGRSTRGTNINPLAHTRMKRLGYHEVVSADEHGYPFPQRIGTPYPWVWGGGAVHKSGSRHEAADNTDNQPAENLQPQGHVLAGLRELANEQFGVSIAWVRSLAREQVQKLGFSRKGADGQPRLPRLLPDNRKK